MRERQIEARGVAIKVALRRRHGDDVASALEQHAQLANEVEMLARDMVVAHSRVVMALGIPVEAVEAVPAEVRTRDGSEIPMVEGGEVLLGGVDGVGEGGVPTAGGDEVEDVGVVTTGVEDGLGDAVEVGEGAGDCCGGVDGGKGESEPNNDIGAVLDGARDFGVALRP